MRIVNWHKPINLKMLFTLYVVFTVGEIVALVSQFSKSPKGNILLYGELMYTYKELHASELAYFLYLIDEIVTRKSL